MTNETKDGTKRSNCNRCYSCGSYECYYTKGYMRLNREKVGYCAKHEKITANKDSCENWRSNQLKKRRLSTLSVKALNETIAQLIEVTNIIAEDIENKHIHYLARERLEKKLNEIEKALEKKD